MICSALNGYPEWLYRYLFIYLRDLVTDLISCSEVHTVKSHRNCCCSEWAAILYHFISCIELLCNSQTVFRISLLLQVLVADEDNMGDGCSQKLTTANILRFLLLVLIPCICALIVLLVILLSFVGECCHHKTKMKSILKSA